MNIFKKIYCRTFQTVLKISIPLLPYREPEILHSSEDIAEVLKQKGVKSVLLVTDKGVFGAGLCNHTLNCVKSADIAVAVYDGTVANPTTDNIDEATAMYRSNNCGAIIAIGGGSAMDCAKATGVRIVKPKTPLRKMKGILKVRKKLPLLIAVPTTAGTGSETTLASVITDSRTRHKYAINDFPLIPAYAVLIPELTAGLPKIITATTGMDALTHAIEAYIGKSTTKKTRKCAIYAVQTIFDNLEKVCTEPDNLTARENMLKASYNAGLAFTVSYVGYVHAVAHSLGGKYNIPHGLANAIILPYVLKKYGVKIFKKLRKLGIYAHLFDKSVSKEEGAKLFIEKIEELNRNTGIGTKIDCIEESDIPALAKTAEKEGNPLYPVPVLWTAKQLEHIYREVRNG